MSTLCTEMDSGIVEGFQNLHVLPDTDPVESLTRSLTSVLDESSSWFRNKLPGHHGDHSMPTCCNMRHPVKKRRCKKRKSLMAIGQSTIIGSNVSEGLDGGGTTSDSCCDDATLTRHSAKFVDCVARLSDSDTATVAVAVLPAVAMVTNALVESDSVTENWSPLRPQRRRRHYRRMIVEDLRPPDDTLPAKHCQMMALPYSSSQQQCHCSQMGHDMLLPGKRKRTVKDKSDISGSFDYDVNEDASRLKPLINNGQSATKMQESAANSSVSSDESEIDKDSEDAGDGDDEQSDFYAEPESSVRMSTAPYTCCDGSSNSKPNMNRATSRDSDSEYAGLVPVDFNAYFAGNWDTLSADSQNQFKARFKLLSGRQFQAGRRRLTDRTRPPYLFSCFLRDRQRWSQSSTSTTWARHAMNTGSNDATGNAKRHRMMTGGDPAVTGVDMQCADEPLQDCKVSFKPWTSSMFITPVAPCSSTTSVAAAAAAAAAGTSAESSYRQSLRRKVV